MIPNELSNRIPKDLFQNTTTSYKFFWCISILDLHKRTGKTVFEFRHIFLRMISEAWFVLRNNKISLGGPDHLRMSVKSVDNNYKREFKSVDDLYDTLVKDISTKYIRRLVDYYSGNVPFRFLTPWVGANYSRDDYSNQNKLFELDTPYAIHKNEVDHYIVINPSWSTTVKGIEDLLIDEVITKLSFYIEKRNTPIKEGYQTYLRSRLLNDQIIYKPSNDDDVIKSDGLIDSKKDRPANDYSSSNKVLSESHEQRKKYQVVSSTNLTEASNNTNSEDIIINEKLVKIQNPRILKEVIPLLEDNKLGAISTLSRLYESDKRISMTFKDWVTLIEGLVIEYIPQTIDDREDIDIVGSTNLQKIISDSLLDQPINIRTSNAYTVWDRLLRYIEPITHVGETTHSYLRQISKYRQISRKETILLFKHYHNGNQKAFDLIVKGHLWMVILTALSNCEQGVSLEDLIQEGNIGLLRAVNSFDESKYVSFTGYANLSIFQTIKDALRKIPCLVRLPFRQNEIYEKIQKFKLDFEQKYEYEPSSNLITIDEDVNPAIIASLSALPSSLNDMCFSDDVDNYESDLFPTDEKTKISDISISVERLLSKRLTDRGKDILKMHFGIGCREMTLEEIGETYGLTRERVRQIVEASIRKLREHNGKKIKSIDEEPPCFPIKVVDTPVSTLPKKKKKEETVCVDKKKNKKIEEAPRISKKENNDSTRLSKAKEIENQVDIKMTHSQNDYDQLSRKLKLVSANSKPTTSYVHGIYGRTQTDVEQQPTNKYTHVTKGEQLNRYETKKEEVRIGDLIKYSSNSTTVNCTVLEIHENTKRLIVRYKNGVRDNIPFIPDRIQILSRSIRSYIDNKYIDSENEWLDSSIALKWLKVEFANGTPRKEIIQKFNKYHRLGYPEFSYLHGYLLTSTLLSKLLKEIVLVEPDNWIATGHGEWVYRGTDIEILKSEIDLFFASNTPKRKKYY